MNSRKIWSIVVAVAMVFCPLTVSFADDTADVPVTETSNAAFTDITDHWGSAAIEKWAGYGIINGFEGLFRPDDSITRGEMAVILDNMMDYQIAAKNTFSDLQADQFYTDAVLKANAAGIIKGDGIAVRPTDKITREEAAVMMSRAFAVPAASSTKGFVDYASVSDWAKDAVFGMEAKGYVNGFEGYFNPKANITRAEAVTMINNIVKAYYTAAGTYTDDVAGTAVIKVADVTLKGVTVSENLIIAEGVAKGDTYLDSVTVKGDTVVRGGGANSIHITGTSSITKITIEKIGDTIRVVIDDGVNVPQVQIGAANEEIVITGTVGTVDIQAAGATVIANAAEINTATITGDNSKLIVGAQSTVNNVTVASTASNTTIETQTGAVVKAVEASAEINVTGTGTVTKVTLNEGANGSSVTTPNTATTVGAGVTGVTGGGGTAIPAGSTGTNSSSGTSATVTGPSGGGGGGGRNNNNGNPPSPSITITSVTVTDAGIAVGSANTVPTTWSVSDATDSMAIELTGSNLSEGMELDVVVNLASPQIEHSIGKFTVTNLTTGAILLTYNNNNLTVSGGVTVSGLPAKMLEITQAWNTLIGIVTATDDKNITITVKYNGTAISSPKTLTIDKP